MGKHKSFKRHVRERTSSEPFVRTFEFPEDSGNLYRFELKPSVGLAETYTILEEEVAEVTKLDPDLESDKNQKWFFRRVGDFMRLILGDEQWRRLSLQIETADELGDIVQWFGDEYQAHINALRAENAEDDDGEDEKQKEVGPDDAPGVGTEGKQAEDLVSQGTTS